MVNENVDVVVKEVSPDTEDNNGRRVTEVKKKFKILGGHEICSFTLNEAVNIDDFKLASLLFYFDIPSRFAKILLNFPNSKKKKNHHYVKMTIVIFLPTVTPSCILGRLI